MFNKIENISIAMKHFGTNNYLNLMAYENEWRRMAMSNQRSETKVHTRMKTITLSPVSQSFLSTLAALSPPLIVFSFLLLHSSSRSPHSVSPHWPVSFLLAPSFPPHPHVSFHPPRDFFPLLPSFPPHPRVSFPPPRVSFPPEPASQSELLSPVRADVLPPDYAVVHSPHSIA